MQLKEKLPRKTGTAGVRLLLLLETVHLLLGLTH